MLLQQKVNFSHLVIVEGDIRNVSIGKNGKNRQLMGRFRCFNEEKTHRGEVSILTWNEDYHPDPVGPIHLGFINIIAKPFPDHFCCYLGTGTEVREDKLDLARPAPAQTACRGQQRQLRQLQSANASYSKKYLLMCTLHWI